MISEREVRIATRRARIAASLRASKASYTRADFENNIDNKDSHFAKTLEMTTTFLKTQLKDKILLLRNLANERAFKYKISSWDSKMKNELALNHKRSAIHFMKAELSQKDDEYSNSINLQHKDVSALLTSMTHQASKLKQLHMQELEKVEKMFLDQRRFLLSSKKLKMAHLLQDRENLYQDEVHSCKDKFLKLLDSIRENDVEDYNTLKIRLEGDSQSLEEHLKVMQAMYQLNAEKLDYNLLVLTEREYENYIMTNQQKKKLTKQRDTLSTIRGRHRDLGKKFMGHNEKLADDYNRVTKLLQDLQLKEQSLQASHASIKQSFFSMHQNMISGVVSRILQADKQIHEEELGWIWKSPCNTILHRLGSRLPRSSKPAESTGLKEGDQFQTLLESFSSERYYSFLLTLNKEACFLIDKESLKHLRDVEAKLQFQVCSATILNALGVGNTYALEKLYIFFTNRMDTDDGVNILKLKSFIQGEYFLESFSAEDDVHNPLTYTVNKNRSCNTKLQHSEENTGKLNWNGYWSSFLTSISPKVLRVYKHLNSALTSYNQMLKDRLYASKDILFIRQRNQRLQITLEYCLSSRQ